MSSSSTLTLSHQFCVYTDWTTEEIPRVFYVGKGNRSRIKNFERNSVHVNITAKHGCQRVIVLETDDENEAFEVEIELIASLKTFMHGGEGWWGANLTLGGDGACGRIWTLEQRAAQSELMKSRTVTAAWCQHISDAQKRLWQDPAHRAWRVRFLLRNESSSYNVNRQSDVRRSLSPLVGM